MGLRASHTHLHIRHALENFEEGQTGEVQEGTLRQLLDLRPQSTKSHNCIRLCTRYWNRQMVGLSNKKKNWWLQKISIKDFTTYICVLFRGWGGGKNLQRKQNGCKNWVHTCRMWVWEYVQSFGDLCSKGVQRVWGSAAVLRKKKKENPTWRPLGWMVDGRSWLERQVKVLQAGKNTADNLWLLSQTFFLVFFVI